MKKEHLWRGGVYVAGILILALGIVLTTKTGLGISPITSLPFAISTASGIPMSVMVFIVYTCALALQFLIRGRNYRIKDLLQLPMSLFFSLFLDLYERAFNAIFTVAFGRLWQNLLLLAVAIILCGAGLFMMISMRLVVNPPDGLFQTISEVYHKDLGLVKNIMDISFVLCTIAVDLIFSGRLVSVGLGTIIAMIFIGRTVGLCNRLFREKMSALAGIGA